MFWLYFILGLFILLILFKGIVAVGEESKATRGNSSVHTTRDD